MSDLIVHEREGELRVSSLDVAEHTKNEHRAVLQLVNSYISDFEQFGQVAFEMRAGYNNAQVRVAHLNEAQATLLITYMRNSEIVRAFKVELVRQFQEMKRALAPVVPDLSTPEGVLALAQTLTQTAEQLVAEKNKVAELTPLASQARTFNKAKGNIGRQKFARGIVNWGVDNGYSININQVYEFLGGRKLDLFVHGVARSDHGLASTSGLRRGYSVTDRGESPINGHPYEQGKLTPTGYEYAWSRIESYVREHGHLELPKKGF